MRWSVALWIMCVVSVRSRALATPDDDLRKRADELAWKGDIAAAVPLYKEILSAKPNDDSTTLALANALSWSKQKDDQSAALPYFDRHLGAHPEDNEARLQRARVRSWTGDISGAERDYRAVMRARASEELEVELAKALSWSKSKADLEKALVLYDRFVARKPHDLDLRLERGRVRGWSGDSSGAREDFSAYLAKHPDDDAVRLELATVTSEGSDPSAAVPLFDAYLRKHPDESAVRLKRARALLWSGDYGAAETALSELRRDAVVRDAADVELARLYAQTGRRLVGLDLLDEVHERSPRDAEARQERDRLAISDHVALRPSFFAFGDRSGIILTAAQIEASVPVVRNFRILGDVAGWSLSSSQEVVLVGRGDLGAWARLPRVVDIEAAAGPRFYQYYSPKLGARVALRAQPAWWLRLDGRWAFDDLYSDLYQPASVVVGIQGHAIHASGDVTLPLHIQISGRVGARFVEPSNDGVEATATAMIRVIKPVSIGYNVQWLGWRYNDPAYWSPQGYAAHLFVLRVAQDIGHFSYDVQGSVGAAAERIQGIQQTGFGPAWGLAGAATFVASPHFTVGFSVQYGLTQRKVFQSSGGGTSIGTATNSTLVSSTYDWITSTIFMDAHF